ncbi:hypothetical protein THII_1043 [Thioploca ingrica]|uniref:T2SS protein K first SAM-like domain-containing protein n=1 Tax=Thioploca ingrica TaxID=40754 RepID=A0A090AK36_9GAMM|nr:hypothetical protein THII_1043 [Thioploca ingrica]
MVMQQSQTGFVLVMTLWVLVILTLAASSFAVWTQRTIERVQTRQTDLQGEIDMYNTQATLIYLLTTQRFTIAGVTISKAVAQEKPPVSLENLADDSKTLEEIMDEFVAMQKQQKQQQNNPAIFGDEDNDTILSDGTEIALDDQPYFGYGKAYFALQDEGGLLNLQLETETVLTRLLSLFGIENELQAPLIAKFNDYIDSDDLHRLNGAEAYHYEERHLPPPRNHFLLHPLEIYRVLDWSDQKNLWKNDQLGQITTVTVAAHPNFNTAPSLVLQAAYNLNELAAERLIKIRQSLPFYTLTTVTQIAGMPPEVDPFETNFFPAQALRLTLWYEGARYMRQAYIRLTHTFDGNKPWQVDANLQLTLLPYYIQTSPAHAPTILFDSTLSAKTL